MKLYRKRSYQIHVEHVKPGTILYNFLENCFYTTDETMCIKCTGTVGEVWPISFEKLTKTYSFPDGARITLDTLPDGEFEVTTIAGENADTVWAEQVQEEIFVLTSWGNPLIANRKEVPHGNGDFIVCANKNGTPDPGDRWVVNGMIFPKTYEEVLPEEV